MTDLSAESPKRILVVEDEPIVALDLQQRLERMGYDVPETAASGEDALDLAQRQPPDLVLMDINLEGEMDGVEAADELTRQRIPVVFLTAYSNDRTLERAKVTGPYGYLLKPFEERELQTTIEVVLYKHQAQEALRLAHDELERRVAERTAELRATNEALRREIEERGRRDARRLALARVREQVWRMQGRADIAHVAEAVWESLEALELPFHECGINVVDPTSEPPTVRSYDRVRSGAWVDLSSTDPEASAAVLAMWRRGEIVYRRDLAAESATAERRRITPVYGDVRAILDVPFSHGTLAVNALEPEAFGDPQVATLQELAEVLSEGFRRLQDLQQLAAERERLAVTLRSIGDCVIATDADGRVALMNRVAEALTGWSQEDAVGRDLDEVYRVLDERSREARDSPVQHVLATGVAVNLDLHVLLVARDGSERPVSTSTAPIRDDEGKTVGVVLVSRDTAAQRRMEEELLKSEKLESLGVLAGGIAHDFNNILTTIVGYLSLAKADTKPESELYDNLSEVEDAAERATDLTRQLLAFSKGGAPVKKTASMPEIVRDSATFTTHGSNVRCEFDIDEALWPAEVDRGQISQVIQNLVINADQAMPEGGRILVSAANVELDADGSLPLAAGRYLRISVQDHGVGIDAERIGRIFDPYYTTKSEGSGLGLATAYAIAKNHEGHITVESEIGCGTRFDVYLPASDGEIPPVGQEEAALVRGQGRILVVDDERPIRRLAAEMLKRLGYEAVLAADGAEAIQMYAEARGEGRPFAAVLVDLTIPGGMGGREAVRQLREADPAVRAIVSSGYSEDPVMADHRRYGFADVVAKPYDIGDLSRVLERVLGGGD